MGLNVRKGSRPGSVRRRLPRATPHSGSIGDHQRHGRKLYTRWHAEASGALTKERKSLVNPIQTTNLLIDLTPFFNEHCSNLRCPWIDQVTFRHIATDGRILIAVESGLALWDPKWDEQQKSFDKPNVGSMLKDFYGVTNWQKWHMPMCKECNNTLRIKRKCGLCDGSGWCTCPRCDREHSCGGCYGTGERMDDCRKCNDPVIFGRKVDREHAVAIARLPNVEVGVVNPDPSDVDNLIFFRFNGGIGAVVSMWRRPDDKDKTG